MSRGIAENPSRGFLFTAPLGARGQAKDFSITPQALFSIGWGFGLSASGGGGSFVDGMGLIQTMINQGFTGITARSITTAPINEAAVISGGMGAPSAIGGGLEDFVLACLAALNALKTSGLVAAPITGITPIEAGPVNGLLPIYICSESQGAYTLYDCDGAGRAVPSLTNLLFDYEGILFSPSAQANIDGTQTSINTTWANGAQAEAGLRDVIAQYGGAIGLAAWAQTGDVLSTAALNVDTYATATQLGQDLYARKSDGFALLTYLQAMAVNPQFNGLTWLATFNEIYRDPDGLANGYDKGYLVFGRDFIEPGFEYRMYYLNENMFISRHRSSDGVFQNYVATAPSTIACFFNDSNPPSETGAQPNDFLPYNTGDSARIEALVGRAIIVSVSSPTPLLYQPDVVASFVTVLNDYFSAPPYGFTFDIGDIYPTNGDPVSRTRWRA